MDQNDPRRIVTLVADSIPTEQAWNRRENRDRYEPATVSGGELVDIPSRGTTPDYNIEPNEPQASKIHLTFDKKPKNLEKGFVFGSDPNTCDVLLGAWGEFSREHFHITFNARGEVILEDTSRTVTSVTYNGEKPKGRNRFTWILFERYPNIEVTLNMAKDKDKNKNEMVFKVERRERTESCELEYQAYRDAYLEDRRNATPSLSRLGVESQYTPRQQPIYLQEEKLGRGSFGTVHKVVNVSTGDEYAGKKFHGGNWKKEVEILRHLSHEHIAKFVDFSEEQEPLLVMEYLDHGNLACQDYITEEDNIQILYQGLQALEYLHSQCPPLIHRDIKPENILVHSRIPFVIKLVDFGLARHDSTLKSFCGTQEYIAPELWACGHYTIMVDIWSLGVVVLQFGYGLPKPSLKRQRRLWCQDIVNAALDMEGEGDFLIDFILIKMLRMNYRVRQSASDCLGEVYRLGFHAVQDVEVRRTTGHDDVTRTRSVIKLRQNGSSVSSGFYKGGASEMPEVAPSKRDL